MYIFSSQGCFEMAVIWARNALLDSGWARAVRIETNSAGLIDSVEPEQKPEGYQVGVLLPAPVNAHSHAFQRAMAGLTERRGPDGSDSFWTWRQLMFRFLDRLTPDDIEVITAFVQMEMLEAGYAASVEFHYLHHQPGGAPYSNIAEMSERIAAAAALTGIGLTLLPVHYEFGGCDRRPLGPGQVRFGNSFERFARLHERAAEALKTLPHDCTLGVAPHSLRAVALEDLKSASLLTAEGPIHMHLSEQAAEVDEILAHYGARPIELFLEQCDASARWCLIHCIQMNPQEVSALASTGAVAGICPITEASLGDGIFNATGWVDAGGTLAIGSDSNVRISLTEELRAIEYSQRLRDQSRAALATATQSTGRRLIELVTRGGAVAAGRNSGVITTGCLADLLAIDDRHVDLVGRSGDTLLDSFIFAADDRVVSDVWSAGRHVVREGAHVARRQITDRYLAIMSALGDAI
jgi:formimidoylglutamate deiminase